LKSGLPAQGRLLCIQVLGSLSKGGGLGITVSLWMTLC
jgi:hypothetical protein